MIACTILYRWRTKPRGPRVCHGVVVWTQPTCAAHSGAGRVGVRQRRAPSVWLSRGRRLTHSRQTASPFIHWMSHQHATSLHAAGSAERLRPARPVRLGPRHAAAAAPPVPPSRPSCRTLLHRPPRRRTLRRTTAVTARALHGRRLGRGSVAVHRPPSIVAIHHRGQSKSSSMPSSTSSSAGGAGGAGVGSCGTGCPTEAQMAETISASR